MAQEFRIITASVVWTGASGQQPQIYAPGAVVYDQAGVIQAVGPAGRILQGYPGLPIHALDHHVLMPGLVNAHAHLELGFLRGQLAGGHFVDWVLELMRQVGSVREPEALAQRTVEAVTTGLAESLAAGVTTIGDITRQTTMVRRYLRERVLPTTRIVSFGEVTALGQRRTGLTERLAVATDSEHTNSYLKMGLSPHAPYTVEGPALSMMVQEALAQQIPLAMHLAELPEEAEFLATLGGRLRELWNTTGKAEDLLDAAIPRFLAHASSPIRWAEYWGLLEASRKLPVVLAHVNYVSDADLEILARHQASVVVCPRTRHFFGHTQPHRYPDMLAQGINVALGTDSLASNPDLCLLKEAAQIRQSDAQFPHQILLEMVTIRGARALGMHNEVGSLETGKKADFIALSMDSRQSMEPDAALEFVVTQAPQPTHIWVEGMLVNRLK